MSSQKFIVTTLAGFVALFLVGFLLYGLLLAQFFATNVGAAVGVVRDPPLIWAIALGNLVMAALLTIVMGKWSGTSGAGPGLQVGAVFGLLMSAGFDLIMYGSTHIMNLSALVADVAVSAVLFGVGGAVVGVMLARK